MSRVLVPLANGFEEIEAVTIIDVLRRAEIEVLVAYLDKNSAVKGANGIIVIADMQVRDISVDTLDMIILPGGWDGTYALADDENVQNILKEMNEKGKSISAICAAPFALHKAGVLKHHYTCYPGAEEQIRLDGFMGDTSMIVEDENIMTSRGPGTAICFALAIVKKLKGEEMYMMLKGGLIADFCE
jgi:4-methyl-5(b-hydroxyethyl)-thiazole monophosphate biosynthesis